MQCSLACLLHSIPFTSFPPPQIQTNSTIASSPSSTEIGMLTVYPHLSCSLSCRVYVNCHCFKCGEVYDRAHAPTPSQLVLLPSPLTHFTSFFFCRSPSPSSLTPAAPSVCLRCSAPCRSKLVQLCTAPGYQLNSTGCCPR